MPGASEPRRAAKKKSIPAAERDSQRVVALRQAFVEAEQAPDVTRFKFVDETSTTLTDARRSGRALAGARAGQGVALPQGAKVPLGAALTTQGLTAALPVDGAVDPAVFAAYLEQVVGPEVKPGDSVVLDNLPVHKAVGLAELVEARGAQLLFLPPYSPDFNPLELAVSQLKTWLRTAAARTRQARDEALIQALAWRSEADAKNWFDHCGYHVQ